MRRLAADQERFALLRGAAEIADTAIAIPEVVDRVGDLLVPAFADICVIDVLRGDRVERLGVVSSRPDAEAIEERLRARGPATPERRAIERAAAAERVDEAFLRANARDEDDYPFLRSLAERSHINVPLRCRGRNVGTLALLAVTRTYSAGDLELAQLIAGRIGLALDNAGLFAELEALQLRLTTALDTLAEAVTIQDEDGRSSTSTTPRRAAFGFASGAELIATPPREIVDAYESFHEDGTPLRMERAARPPGARGQRRRSRCWCARSTARTGEERWRMVKATAVPRASRGSRSTSSRT